MSIATNAQAAFPAIKDDDLFGGFGLEGTSDKASDPLDPFSAQDDASKLFAEVTEAAVGIAGDVNNPFLSFAACDEEPSELTSTSETVDVERESSSQSEGVPRPGKNTLDTSESSSLDSAALITSSDNLLEDRQTPSKLESSGSEKNVPNIALDSDSGNITADVNESFSQPNAVYGLLEDEPPLLQIPTVIFTEATMNSDTQSSSFEVVNDAAAPEEGQTRLLESSESAESGSANASTANIISLSSSSSEFIVVDNLSTMNISDISAANPSEALGKTEPLSADEPDYFATSEKTDCEENLKFESVNLNQIDDAELLPKPKTNRVFTSSPICNRAKSPEPERSPTPLEQWRVEYNDRLMSKDENEELEIRKLKEEAKNELENFYRERQSQIQRKHDSNIEDQQVLQALQPDNKTVWGRMASLASDLHRTQKATTDDKKKDTSRMKYLLQLLAAKGPAKTAKAAPEA